LLEIMRADPAYQRAAVYVANYATTRRTEWALVGGLGPESPFEECDNHDNRAPTMVTREAPRPRAGRSTYGRDTRSPLGMAMAMAECDAPRLVLHYFRDRFMVEVYVSTRFGPLVFARAPSDARRPAVGWITVASWREEAW
jgi:hypothetical protein